MFSIKLETIIYPKWRRKNFPHDSRVAFNYMQHWLNRVINFRLANFWTCTRDGVKKSLSHPCETFSIFLVHREWKSKEFIYIHSNDPLFATSDMLQWNFFPSLSFRPQKHSCHSIQLKFQAKILRSFTQINPELEHMSSMKETFFLFVVLSILLDGKFVKWFMRSSLADNKSFVELFSSLLVFDVMKRKT